MIYLDKVGYSFLINEIKERITGHKIRKIHSHDTNSFSILFNKLTLYFENKTEPIIYLKEKKVINSNKELNFILRLKKYILGGTILDVYLLNDDRIVVVEIEKLDMFNEYRKYKLIYEFLGKSVSVLLLDENDIIITSMYANIGKRINLSGAKYEIPEVGNKYGHLMKNLDEETRKEFENSYNPLIYENNLLTYNDFLKMKYVSYDSLNTALNVYFEQNNNISQLESKRKPILKYINRNIKRLEKILLKIPQDIENNKDYEKYKIRADILASNLYKLSYGQKNITLFNYYDNSDITIELDENISPSLNLKKLYDKYAKQKRRERALIERLDDIKEEIDYYKEQEYYAINSSDILSLEQIEKELGIKNKSFSSNKNKKREIEKIEYQGFTIYVGKNSIENEEITFKIANKNDMWFHSKDVPGSHVIIKGNDIPEDVINYAAKIAATNSKLNGFGLVDYCYIKNVKKIAGSKKALVTYDKYNTINVK